MQYTPEPRLEVCEHAIDRFFELEPDDRRRRKYIRFVADEARLSDADRIVLRKSLAKSRRSRSIPLRDGSNGARKTGAR